MILSDAIHWLESQGIDAGYYCVGDLGGGEIYGIEKFENGWSVYFSERGDKRNRKNFEDEHEAVRHFLKMVARTVKEYEGLDLEIPE